MSLFSYSILSIDGGGIRGIIPSMVLIEIEKRVKQIQIEKLKAVNPDAVIPKEGKKIAEMFDLIAGTSTGGMLAAGLSVPIKETGELRSAQDLLSLYKGKKAKRIFKKPLGFLNNMLRVTRSLFPARFINDVLKKEFGEARLAEAQTDLLVTSYDGHNKKPFYFRSRLAKSRPAVHDFKVRDMCRATSAAPTYFPPKLLAYQGADSNSKDLSLIDGGIFANNPSMLAYVEAMDLWKQDADYKRQFKTTTDKLLADKEMAANPNPDNFAPPILLVSIGTGQTKNNYPHKAKGWGFAKAASIIDIAMQGVSESVHYQMQYLLPPYEDSQSNKTARYYRLNIDVPPAHSEMSDTSDDNIAALEELGKKLIAANSEQIDMICNCLYEMTPIHRRRNRKKKQALAQAIMEV